MLQHEEKLYLPTQKLYSVLDDSRYQETKTAHLNSVFPGYANKTVFEKWELLIKSMEDGFTLEEMPIISEGTPPVAVSMTVATTKERFEKFKTKRKNTSVSMYNLTLEQCVSYFEDFNFIYKTPNPNYNLNLSERKSLIKSILEAMEHCEIGINGRFYAVLQEHQKSTNWIASEITKARCEALRELGQKYNTGRQVTDVLNIHTFDILVEFANQDGLGIPQKEKIWDVFGFLMNKSDLKAFFNKHRGRQFQKYEREIEQTLETHIFSELVKAIPGVNVPEWDNGLVNISQDEIDTLIQFLGNHFPGVSQGATNDILEPNLEYTAFQLKSKPECLALIRSLIRKKLIGDGYYVDVAATQQNQHHDMLKLHNDITIEQLLNYFRALNQEQHNPIAQREAELLVNTYPELLYQTIQRHPELLATFKPWIKNTLLSDQLLKILDRELIAAITDNDEVKIKLLIQSIMILINDDPEFITQLSPQIWNHLTDIRSLLEKEGALLAYLPQTLCTPQNLALAKQSNPFVVANIEYLLGHRNSDTSTFAQEVANRNRQAAIRDLKSDTNVDISTFMQKSRYITPRDLVNIIKARKQAHLSPLPFCVANNIEEELEKYNGCVNTENEWQEKGYLAIRRKACQRQSDIPVDNDINAYVGDDINAYVVRSPNWFKGFVQYQQNQVKYANIWLRSQIYLRALLKVILFIALLYLSWHFLWMALPYFFMFTQAIFEPGFCVWLAVLLINSQLRNRWVGTFNFILWHIITLDWQFLKAMLVFMIINFVQVIYNTVQFLRIIPFATETLLRIRDADSYYKIAQAESWLEKCNQVILRLEMQDEPSSHQKATILKSITTRFTQEDRPNDEQLVHKKYPIAYQGREYLVSFADVAKQKRDKTETFSLEPVSKAWCGLFKVATSSENLMPEVVESRGLQIV